ncbi:hypothetical protein [Staphylococcus hominis]|uniref:hypothetical protein n=1 Tax=Staphylococcus hominis TaxID=1290 RepID=UPI0011A67C12|nr:hypothetical protein [Staphylococcus hominis]
MFGLWLFISLIFIILLIISILKSIKKQKSKKLWIITLITFLIGFGVFIKAGSDNSIENNTENKNVSETKKSKNDDSEFSNAVDDIVDEIRFNKLDEAQSLYENDTITKDELKHLNSQIFKRTDEVKKEIKKDKNYKEYEKRYENDDFDQKEMNDFLAPYLEKIQNTTNYK